MPGSRGWKKDSETVVEETNKMTCKDTQQGTTKGKYETAVTGMERQASRCTTNPQLISDGRREFWGRVSVQRWRVMGKEGIKEGEGKRN